VAHSEGHAAPTEKHSRRQLAKTRMHELDVEVEAMVGKVLEKAEQASNARQRRRRRAKRAPDMKGTHVPNPLRGGMQNPMFADSEDGEVASD
jgi:lipopolysaccharide biosynthesis regulator YciM